jgi:carboxypeptidase T
MMSSPSRQLPTLCQRFRCTPRVERLEDRSLLTFYGGYLTVDELQAQVAAFASSFSDITELIDYGDSYSKTVGGVTTPGGEFIEGYDLQAVRISNRAIAGPKPAFIVVTGLHSREITTPEVGLRFFYYMLGSYGVDADVTWMVDHHEIWWIPLANPDGHWYVELGTQEPYSGNPWLWRKNGHPNSCEIWPPNPRSGEAYGVDLNRNFDDHWGTEGVSDNPCSQVYPGESMASEPETVALQDLVRRVIPDQRGPDDDDPAPDNTTGIFIDIHTQGGFVLWPWGHTPAPAPNGIGMRDIGRKFASYNGYRAGQSYQTLYPTSGTTKGFVYGELGAPAYTIEMDSGTFLAPYSRVDAQLWPEMYQTLLYATRIARTPYMLARGPDTTFVWPYQDGSYFYFFSPIDDRSNGGQAIQRAEFYIDTPPWLPGATPVAMSALDGSFDSSYEDVWGYFSTIGLPPGRHIVFVRGQDAAGNWGPVSATFIEIGSLPGAGGSEIMSVLVTGARPNPVPPALHFPQPELASIPPTPVADSGSHLPAEVEAEDTRTSEPAGASPFEIDFTEWDQW